MLKKPAGVVLASFRPSTSSCGLAGLFNHPPYCQFIKMHYRYHMGDLAVKAANWPWSTVCVNTVLMPMARDILFW
jgi:hypothetical protein